MCRQAGAIPGPVVRGGCAVHGSHTCAVPKRHRVVPIHPAGSSGRHIATAPAAVQKLIFFCCQQAVFYNAGQRSLLLCQRAVAALLERMDLASRLSAVSVCSSLLALARCPNPIDPNQRPSPCPPGLGCLEADVLHGDKLGAGHKHSVCGVNDVHLREPSTQAGWLAEQRLDNSACLRVYDVHPLLMLRCAVAPGLCCCTILSGPSHVLHPQVGGVVQGNGVVALAVLVLIISVCSQGEKCTGANAGIGRVQTIL